MNNVVPINRGKFNQHYSVHQAVSSDDGAGGLTTSYIVKGVVWAWLRQRSQGVEAVGGGHVSAFGADLVIDQFHDISPGDLLSNSSQVLRVESRELNIPSDPYALLRCRSDPSITALLGA